MYAPRDGGRRLPSDKSGRKRARPDNASRRRARRWWRGRGAAGAGRRRFGGSRRGPNLSSARSPREDKPRSATAIRRKVRSRVHPGRKATTQTHHSPHDPDAFASPAYNSADPSVPTGASLLGAVAVGMRARSRGAPLLPRLVDVHGLSRCGPEGRATAQKKERVKRPRGPRTWRSTLKLFEGKVLVWDWGAWQYVGAARGGFWCSAHIQFGTRFTAANDGRPQ